MLGTHLVVGVGATGVVVIKTIGVVSSVAGTAATAVGYMAGM